MKKPSQLDDEIFSYRETKDGSLMIDWQGQIVKTFKGKEANRVLSRLNDAATDQEIQLILAKATGNFKRGNERLFKK